MGCYKGSVKGYCNGAGLSFCFNLTTVSQLVSTLRYRTCNSMVLMTQSMAIYAGRQVDRHVVACSVTVRFDLLLVLSVSRCSLRCLGSRTCSYG